VNKSMKIYLIIPLVIIFFSLFDLSAAFLDDTTKYIENSKPLNLATNAYGIQWEMSYGRSPFYGARYEGPQPIGDCDNDGDNELLIGGRDAMLRVMEWNDDLQTYEQTHTLRGPFYPLVRQDSDGFAIGDVTGDGDNEIVVSWYATVHKFVNGRYRIIAWNPWVEWNGGGNPDCYIGDCDNDGLNEVIMSCRDWRRSVPEIVIFKWNGKQLVKYADWDDVGVNGEVFMAGLGDVDEDGENEIVCASENKVIVLNWDAQNKTFISTIIYSALGQDSPFGVVCKDCDNDGKAEILLSYVDYTGTNDPRITIFKWNGTGYPIQFDITWPGGEPVIEGIDVGDTDDDGLNEVVVGAGLTHILQWNGTTYVEEAVLPTFGWMAVVCIGDCDNDGKNEINAGNVIIELGQQYTEWVFKYGLET
jgi:hypothetical protein